MTDPISDYRPLQTTLHIHSWDLVSAYQIVGAYLEKKDQL